MLRCDQNMAKTLRRYSYMKTLACSSDIAKPGVEAED